MSVGEYCNREVVIVSTNESVREAVNLMRHHHVGSVVVVDGKGDAVKPKGILTDRDVVVELLAEDVDLTAVNVGDVMSADLVTVDESFHIFSFVLLRQLENESQDQKQEEYTLLGMQHDGEPVTTEAFAGQYF